MPKLRLLPPVSVVETVEESAAAMEYFMRRGGAVAIDTETTGLDVMRDRVLFWSMATEERRYSISASLLPRFDALFARRDMEWYLANAKFDMHMLTNMGVTLQGPKSDIIVMDAMDDDTRPHGLKEQGWLTYEANWGDFKDLFLDPAFVSKNLGLDRKSFTAFKNMSVGDKLLFVYDERPDIVHDYASCDAYFTYLLAEDLKERLSNFELPTNLIPEMNYMYDLFRVIEQPLTEELWKMERNGMLIDLDYVKSLDGPLREGLASLKLKIAKMVGRDFNPDSDDQIRDLLFNDPKGFQLNAALYTSGGKSGVVKKSVNAKSLKILKDRVPLDSTPHRFLLLLEEYNKIEKIHNTYVKNVHKHVGPDGRYHCRINQAGARTGRMSTSGPSLQNIPVRDDKFKVRGMFVAPPGYKLLDADYPQIEFRVVAVLAEEEEMLEAMRRGWDIHSANAPLMFSEVTYEQIMEAVRKKEAKESLNDWDKHCLRRRGHAKETGLASLYGQGPRAVAEKLGCSVEEAKELIETFFDRFKGIAELRENTWDFAYANEMTYTMLGRCRRLWSINGGNRGLEAADRRKALNCLDYDTEVLTPSGWKNGHDVAETETILSKNAETGELEWQLAYFRHFPEYTGELHVWKSRSFSAATTPEHRWLVDMKSGHTRCVLTKDFRGHGDERIHRTGVYARPHGNDWSDDDLRVLGWAATDATHKTYKSGRKSIIISQVKKTQVAKLKKLLIKYGVEHRRPSPSGQYFWDLGVDLSERFEPHVRGRLLSYELIWSLTPQQARVLLETIQAADGKSPVASTRDKAERYQALAIVAGYSATIHRREPGSVGYSDRVQPQGVITKKPYYTLNIQQRDRAQVIKRHMSVRPAEGVYCPVVPNTYMVVRRNDCVYITGNTAVQGSSAEMMKLAIIRVGQNKDLQDMGFKLLMTIHDELIGEVPAEHAEEANQIFCDMMGDPYRVGPIQLTYPVSIQPDGVIIDRWSEAK